MVDGYGEFELDLTKALLQHLPPMLDGLKPAPLTHEAVSGLPANTQGVYMLLEDGNPTYIGKTDATHGFSDRLLRHVYTLSARRNLDLSRIEFKALRVMVFTVMNVEAMLIKHYIGDNPLSWQNSGFGSNDPGHNREAQEPSEFDQRYPINIDVPHGLVPAGKVQALRLLIELKDHLPFDFRYQTDIGANGKPKRHTVGHADHRGTELQVPRSHMSLRELLSEVITRQLPAGWVATIFPGRVILYKEDTIYRYALEQIKR